MDEPTAVVQGSNCIVSFEMLQTKMWKRQSEELRKGPEPQWKPEPKGKVLYRTSEVVSLILFVTKHPLRINMAHSTLARGMLLLAKQENARNKVQCILFISTKDSETIKLASD